MVTTTTNYGWNKPEVGADKDLWGGYLNANWDDLDTELDALDTAKFAVAGGLFTGDIGGGDYSPNGWSIGAGTDPTYIAKADFYRQYGGLSLNYTDVADGDYRASLYVYTNDAANRGIFFDLDTASPDATWTPLICYSSTGGVLTKQWEIDGIASFVDGDSIGNRDACDGRYVQLAGSTMTGALSFSGASARLNPISGTISAQGLHFGASGLGFYVPAAGILRLSDGVSTNYAQFDSEGSGLAQTFSVVTRAKGDARYARLAAANTFAAAVDFDDAVTFNDSVNVLFSGVTGGGSFTEGCKLYNFNNGAGYDVAILDMAVGSAGDDFRFNRSDAQFEWRIDGSVYGQLSSVNGLTISQRVATRAGTGPASSNLGLMVGSTNGLYTVDPAHLRVGIGGGLAAQFEASGTGASAAVTVITREKGDARYSLASSMRYKDEVAEASPPADLFDLPTYSFVYGGELEEDDPRRGRRSFGVMAEDLQMAFPEAVEVDEHGRPDRVNLGPVVFALLAEVKRLRRIIEE